MAMTERASNKMTQDINAQQLKESITGLMSNFTSETTPGSSLKVPDYREHLREGSDVYVTFLPGSNLDDTISLCKRLKDETMNPIPHFAARSIPSKEKLESMLGQVTEQAGVNRALIIAGGVSDKDILGPYSNSMQLLETGLFDRFGIKTIGVAGHPEGSPDMPNSAIWDAIKWKNDFAARSDADFHIVTQFCFEAEPIIAWDKQLTEAGNSLPVHIGLPGLATIKTLLAFAKAAGVGPSMRFISRQAAQVHKLLTVSDPNKQLTGLAKHCALNPNSNIKSVHMYPLGGLRRTAAWSYAVRAGDFSLDKQGFKLNNPIE